MYPERINPRAVDWSPMQGPGMDAEELKSLTMLRIPVFFACRRGAPDIMLGPRSRSSPLVAKRYYWFGYCLSPGYYYYRFLRGRPKLCLCCEGSLGLVELRSSLWPGCFGHRILVLIPSLISVLIPSCTLHSVLRPHPVLHA